VETGATAFYHGNDRTQAQQNFTPGMARKDGPSIIPQLRMPENRWQQR
jgi:hypothetical protein